MKKIFFFAFILTSFSTFAQQGTVRGTVFEDATGFSIIGGNVAVKGSDLGAVTDLDGTFSLLLDPGNYTLEISYTGFQTVEIADVEVIADKVTLLENIRIQEASEVLETVVVTAKAIRTSEVALLTVKKKSPVMMDGISSARFKLTGDGTAVEAAKRVTGVSIEGGKYVYIRGLGDRYSKTTLNGVDIPGLDPDRNTLQMDIFPTNLINNIMVSKNFTADMPADFTGGLLNVETKDFPEEKFTSVSLGTSYNPDMHFNSDYITYNGGDLDFLGFDDGTRELPAGADANVIPFPGSGASQDKISSFVRSFNPELGVIRKNSLMDYSAGISMGNQFNLKNDNGKQPTIGYIFSLSYKNSYKYYDDVVYGEYQRSGPDDADELGLTYANLSEGELGERNVLVGALAGVAYKNRLSKLRLTAMRLQNGESRAGRFLIRNNGEAVGQSGYVAESNNLEYNERSLTNVLLHGTHVIKDSGWEVDWRVSPTLSTSDDPDIRKSAFTYENDTTFNAGAGGTPSRIWRSLNELNATAKFDITKKYDFKGQDAKLKFGASHVYKERDYEILTYNVQFFGAQSWENPDPTTVLNEENLYPNQPNSIYYQSGNLALNPNEYNSTVNNTGFYVSNEFSIFKDLKTILGVRAENFVQHHTGRDILWGQGNPNGRNLDNEKVLESFDLFPSANFIYSLTGDMNLRASYARTIARPSFKELSFAQIIDPITNRIFNGSLFPFVNSETGEMTWDGKLVQTDIDNIDLRWELFQQGGQLFSVSAFYKGFDNPIELVRIPEQQTSQEFQPRNVGTGQVYGLEFEIRKQLSFLSPTLGKLSFSTNVTLVQSEIDMADVEYNERKKYERQGETIDRVRDMAGQSPYVINAGFTYRDSEAGLDAGLFYNVKGSTLQVVGIGLYPDVYTEPFHSLNFSINKRLGEDKKTSIDFKVSNILGDKVESFFKSYETEDQIYSSFSPGRAFSFGISRNF